MVYVDEMFSSQKNKYWPYNASCHLIADTVEELHIFAQNIGLKREWFQNKSLPHYDLTQNVRRLAVKNGAKEVDGYEFVRIMRKLRGRKGVQNEV